MTDQINDALERSRQLNERVQQAAAVEVLKNGGPPVSETPVEFGKYPQGGAHCEPNNFRRVTIKGIHDGDTASMDIELGAPGVELLHPVKRTRLAGLNAPEISDQKGTAATAHLEQLCGAYASRGIVAEILGRDNYGRLIVVLWGTDHAGNAVNINQKMIADGFAKELLEGKT